MQDVSVNDQRIAATEHASRKGYVVVNEYVDEAKSGSKDVNKRIAFMAMLHDSNSGQFDVIVCWDLSRFGRLDSIDGAFAKGILRTNGVHLDTVKDGDFRWDTSEGRWKDMAFSEAAHAQARATSKDLSLIHI
jgi:DNA invertase Pin-like site-specific DNA recombinase